MPPYLRIEVIRYRAGKSEALLKNESLYNIKAGGDALDQNLIVKDLLQKNSIVAC